MSMAVLLMYAAYSEGEGGGLLSVNPGLAFWTVLIFLLLLLILKKFAWKPILESLDERENKIKESLESAEKARNDAQVLIEENRKNLAKAEEEAKKIIEESRTYAERVKTQIMEDSKAQAAKVIENATAEIDRKRQEMFSDLKNQIADISVEIAEKIIRKNLDKTAQSDIINKSIDEIRKN
ncbi:MAG: F0F1 ATP synthase subunit B [Ignavibacteriaceae bacterium]|nr:F0F1 ATP synthase subunit B [Ignavibacteriaceae bacterium]